MTLELALENFPKFVKLDDIMFVKANALYTPGQIKSGGIWPDDFDKGGNARVARLPVPPAPLLLTPDFEYHFLLQGRHLSAVAPGVINITRSR